MKVKDLLRELDYLPIDGDWDIVLSKHFVIDEQEELWGMLDIPVVGIVKNEDDKELRFILRGDDVKSCFGPDDVLLEE